MTITKNKILTIEKEKGVAIYMTIVFMAVLLAMVLGVTSIIINGLSISRGVTESVKAFHAADTGVEASLYQVRRNNDCTPTSSPAGGLGGDPEWRFEITYPVGSCSTTLPSLQINSKGIFHEAQRGLEVAY